MTCEIAVSLLLLLRRRLHGTLQASFGMPDNMSRQWCAECSKEYPGAINKNVSMCEDCAEHQASYGLPNIAKRKVRHSAASTVDASHQPPHDDSPLPVLSPPPSGAGPAPRTTRSRWTKTGGSVKAAERNPHNSGGQLVRRLAVPLFSTAMLVFACCCCAPASHPLLFPSNARQEPHTLRSLLGPTVAPCRLKTALVRNLCGHPS